MNRPADEFIAGFVGAETILPGVVTDANSGTISVDVGGRQVMAVATHRPVRRSFCASAPNA